MQTCNEGNGSECELGCDLSNRRQVQVSVV